MKSLERLILTLITDLGDQLGVSTARDLVTVTSRFEHEGVSFLTITLPTYAKGLEQALSRECADPSLWKSFSSAGRLPRFLGGFADLVFDRKSGRLLPDPNIGAIWAIRQISGFLGKLFHVCSANRVTREMERYVECDKEVYAASERMTSDIIRDVSTASWILFGDAFDTTNREISDGSIVPRHGPGATADRLRGNQKWRQSEWTERLEQVFPCSDYLIPSYRWWEEVQHVDILEPGAERPVKVIPVPKTAARPRLIAVEPTCMQYMQQALFLSLRPGLEATGVVGITNQQPNRDFAETGSSSGLTATLDLSEASDRVPLTLVRAILRPWPLLEAGVMACRSTKADVPGFGVMPLAKFASMGSALCFPMEAVVFASAAFVGIARALNLPCDSHLINRWKPLVRVYGDDIIIPAHFAESVSETLALIGAKVNRSKSFWTGKFRESCGGEFYDGCDVSYVKVRQNLPRHRRQHREVIATISLRNELYKAGCWGTVRYLDNMLESLRIPMPRVIDSSPVLGRLSFLGYQTDRVGSRYQTPLVRGVVVLAKSPSSRLNGVHALQKCLSHPGISHYDPKHLVAAGRPECVSTTIRMAQPF